MSARPITVRKLKEILRLKYQAQLAHRQIALSPSYLIQHRLLLPQSRCSVGYHYLGRSVSAGMMSPLERASISTRAVSKTRHKPLS